MGNEKIRRYITRNVNMLAIRGKTALFICDMAAGAELVMYSNGIDI